MTAADTLLVPVGGDFVPVGELVAARRRAGLTTKLRLGGTLLPEEAAELRRVRESQFFLVRNRNGGTGERYRCARCGVRHEYFTWMCVDRPWRGLDGALFAYAELRGDALLQRRLITWTESLQVAHPQTFAHAGVDPHEADVLAVAVGELEPISETRARQLARTIQGRRPPGGFTL